MINKETLKTSKHFVASLDILGAKEYIYHDEECVKSNWCTRQLERQINTFFYERLLSSHDKEYVKNEIFTLEPQAKSAKDIIRDPYAH